MLALSKNLIHPARLAGPEATMKTVRSVLLVHDEPDAFRELEETLHNQAIQTSHAHQCAEARKVMKEDGPIDLVLTDVALADGTWKDVIRSVHRVAKRTPVIVMSRVVDMRLYLDTQDAGAADFIVPPMAPRDLAYTLAAAIHRISAASIGHARAHRHDPPVQ
jgi:DNA-binding NtrC family response regulator